MSQRIGVARTSDGQDGYIFLHFRRHIQNGYSHKRQATHHVRVCVGKLLNDAAGEGLG